MGLLNVKFVKTQFNLKTNDHLNSADFFPVISQWVIIKELCVCGYHAYARTLFQGYQKLVDDINNKNKIIERSSIQFILKDGLQIIVNSDVNEMYDK